MTTTWAIALTTATLRAGCQLQVVGSFDVRSADEVDPARVDDDELGALAEPLLHARCEDRVSVGGVGADEQHDVGLIDGLEVLRARGRAERLLEPVASGRVADACAGVDVVVAERGAHHLLDDVDLFVGAARRRDAANGADAVLGLNLSHASPDVADGFVPLDLAPLVGDVLAHHRLHDPVRVSGVTESEATLDAGVAFVGAAVLVRNHAHQLVAAQLCFERATDTAVRASGDDRSVRHPEVDDTALLQGCRGARLHTCATGDAVGRHESLADTGGNLGVEAAALDREREGALYLVAGTHAS